MVERAESIAQLQPGHAPAFATAAELAPLSFVLCDNNAYTFAARPRNSDYN